MQTKFGELVHYIGIKSGLLCVRLSDHILGKYNSSLMNELIVIKLHSFSIHVHEGR